MRYDKDIYFVTKESAYNAETGDYDDGTPYEEHRKASVMDMGTEMQRLLYDGPKRGTIVVTLQNHYDKPFEWIMYNGKRYQVDRTRKLRVKTGFFCSEV